MSSPSVRLRSFLYQGIYLIAASLLSGNAACLEAAERLWQMELKRVAQEIDRGNYSMALRIAREFQSDLKESKKKLTPEKLRFVWQKYEIAHLWSVIALGGSERYSGQEDAAERHLIKAVSLIDRAQARTMPGLLAARQAGQGMQELGQEQQLAARDAAAEGRGTARITAQAEANLAQGAALESAAMEYMLLQEACLLEMLDGLAAISLDRVLPWRSESIKHLRSAEKWFERSSVVRERGIVSDDSMSLHGSQLATFARNHARLFLKQAEFAAFKDERPDDVDYLLERASFYFREAEKAFDKRANQFGLALNTNGDESPDEVPAADSESSDAIREAIAIRAGKADLLFNRAEWCLTAANSAANKDDRQKTIQLLTQAEELLMTASEILAKLNFEVPHPNLVLTWSQLAMTEALRMRHLGVQEDPELTGYLQRARQLMTTRELSANSIFGVYVATTMDVLERARGTR